MSATIDDTCACGARFTVRARDAVMVGYRHMDWLTAHEPCRGRTTPGKCLDRYQTHIDPASAPVCTLTHGHKGAHTDGRGMHWIIRDEDSA